MFDFIPPFWFWRVFWHFLSISLFLFFCKKSITNGKSDIRGGRWTRQRCLFLFVEDYNIDYPVFIGFVIVVVCLLFFKCFYQMFDVFFSSDCRVCFIRSVSIFKRQREIYSNRQQRMERGLVLREERMIVEERLGKREKGVIDRVERERQGGGSV